ncbi:hypothetical protein HDV02_002501 [Globomyces sp. JEL0801]|nr:hypothetical protein HDV02_002501 [Globomyces sp. JEL0801]
MSNGRPTADVGFHQDPPVLTNQYLDDSSLQGILYHYLPQQVLQEVSPDLVHIGERTLLDISEWGDNAENHPPSLTQYDHWSRRIDKLELSEGWRALKDMSATEGLVAIGYERKYAQYSRVYQFAKLYLAVPSTAMFGCPLAMTDGGARLLELYADEDLKKSYLPHLISRNPHEFWTSGQWMTERPGGSDVGGTESEAQFITEKTANITGFKWFSSATDSQITFLLARTKNRETGATLSGSKGLTLFCSKLHDDKGKLNGIRIHRLKKKFGTKALPTAELELHDLPGTMLGAINRGVATIAVILNITRIYSALSTIASLRRSYAIAKSYSTKRIAFGKRLSNQPLHLVTLSSIDLTLRACQHLLFYSVKLLGESECHPDTQQLNKSGTLLRLITPLVKMWCCHIALPAISESMEACGGQGYMEETGIARQYRDAQVNAIWEGTTNVQALDLMRMIHKIFPIFKSAMLKMNSESSALVLNNATQNNLQALEIIETTLKQFATMSQSDVERKLRSLGFAMARTLAGFLLTNHAFVLEKGHHPDSNASLITARRWSQNVNLLIGDLKDSHTTQIEDDIVIFGSSSTSKL